MEREIQTNQGVPMEEDEIDTGEGNEASNVNKEEGQKAQAIDTTETNQAGNEAEKYITAGARAKENELRNFYLIPDEFESMPLNLADLDGVLDEEDMEIQRLTQSLQQLGTGRIQRSLLTDAHEPNPGASTDDTDS